MHETFVIPKGAHNVLSTLTGQSRPDVAFSLAIKELVQYRIKSTKDRIAAYENKYEMSFAQFEEAWKEGKIKDPYSYPVEQDYMQWETALADLNLLEEIVKWQV